MTLLPAKAITMPACQPNETPCKHFILCDNQQQKRTKKIHLKKLRPIIGSKIAVVATRLAR
jgi:hypothetical protein